MEEETKGKGREGGRRRAGQKDTERDKEAGVGGRGAAASYVIKIYKRSERMLTFLKITMREEENAQAEDGERGGGSGRRRRVRRKTERRSKVEKCTNTYKTSYRLPTKITERRRRRKTKEMRRNRGRRGKRKEAIQKQMLLTLCLPSVRQTPRTFDIMNGCTLLFSAF